MTVSSNDTVDSCLEGYNASILAEMNITCPADDHEIIGGWSGTEFFTIPRTIQAASAKDKMTILCWCVGFLGNILTICVLTRKSFKHTSSSVYMRGLAVADIVALWGYFLRHMSEGYFTTVATLWYCRATVFMLSYGATTGSWLIVAMSTERLIAVTWPLKAGTLCTKSRAKIAVIALAIFGIGFNLQGFWTQTSVVEADDYMYCSPDYVNYGKYFSIWEPIDASVSLYIPAFGITIINILIIVQVRRAQKTQKSMRSGDDKKAKNASESQKGKGGGAASQTNQITAMLLSVSIIYWITMVPVSIYFIYFPYWIKKPYNPGFYADVVVVQAVAYILININHAVNFILYCITGKKFRQELVMMLLCREKRAVPTSTNTYMYSTTNVSTVASAVPARAVSTSDVAATVAEKQV